MLLCYCYLRVAAAGLLGRTNQLFATHSNIGSAFKPSWLYLPAEQRDAIKRGYTSERVLKPKPAVQWWYCADDPQAVTRNQPQLGLASDEPEGDDVARMSRVSERMDSTASTCDDGTGAVAAPACLLLSGGPSSATIWEVRAKLKPKGRRGMRASVVAVK